MLRRFLKDDTGAAAVEYGLIAGVICLAIIAGVAEVADGLMRLWGEDSELYNALK